MENDKFYIWRLFVEYALKRIERKDIKTDVAEEIKEFAQVEKAEMTEEVGDDSRWVYNKVIFRETLIKVFPCAEFALQSSNNHCKVVRIRRRL